MKLPVLWFQKRKDDLSEELQMHLEMATADRVERGDSPKAARQNAQREMGNLPLVADVTRATWGWMWLEQVLQDARYAARQLHRDRIFSIAALLTLALGLGATAAMYTVVDRVLLRPLPYRDADSLVAIQTMNKTGGPGDGAALLDIQQWQRQSRTLRDIAYYSTLSGAHSGFLEGRSGVTLVAVTQASGNLFQTLGVEAAMGRTFLKDPDGAVKPQDAHTIVLSDAVWRAVFAADPHILGKIVRISGESYAVLGVMPRGFTFPYVRQPLVWEPIIPSARDQSRTRFETPTYDTISRLAPGRLLRSAAQEMNVIQADVVRRYADNEEGDRSIGIKLKRYSELLVDEGVRRSLLALTGAAGVLWLIACVNVTSLLLARASARRRELALRVALGRNDRGSCNNCSPRDSSSAVCPESWAWGWPS